MDSDDSSQQQFPEPEIGKEKQPMTVPIHHATGWVDHGVLSIATACNLCDAYVHDQVRFEWDNANKDVELDSSSFDDADRQIQIQVCKTLLFDESSIRLEEVEDSPERP